MANAVASRPFLLERVHEWSLLRAITLGESWTSDALTGASNWLQLKVAEGQSPIEAAISLVQVGRTKRIRNTARATLAFRSGR